MFKIGYRTLKTAIGTVIAIMIAQFFGLDNFASAGILTILCIKPTRRKSLKAAFDRILACFLSLFLASAMFEWIAYHPIVIGVLLLIFIPITVKWKIQEGIVTSSVIILHVYMAGQVSFHLIVNESYIILIGILVALILNIYMPSLDKNMGELKDEIEKHFSSILSEMAHYLKTNEELWQGAEITDVSEKIKEGKALASKDLENNLLQGENIYYTYFKMREKQFELIERLLPLLTSFQFNSPQRIKVANFIEELSTHVHPGNTAHHFLYKLYQMKHEFKEMPLPTTRDEFEERAALLNFVSEMEKYLQIKSHFRGIYQKG
ncbi:aromatic acid exporter family protein [Bacillus carboniphilus]|uniref:Aromatic acid exporter family protein n=1 Tax=Bacillus carboniphilus TaxID=86663 RepID=A0ABP3GLP7_9BACI